jgi:hypothetical protein
VSDRSVRHTSRVAGDPRYVEPEVGFPSAKRRTTWLSLPREISASLLAILTVPLSLPPTHLPPWAVFVSWAGTFAAGGPKPETLRKLAPVQPLGSVTAMIIVLLFGVAAELVPAGAPMVIAEMAIIFVLNSAMIFVARVVPLFSFIPGMFFGFASYFATYFGGWGLVEQNPYHALWATILMNAIGLCFAYLNVKTTREADQHH